MALGIDRDRFWRLTPHEISQEMQAAERHLRLLRGETVRFRDQSPDEALRVFQKAFPKRR